MTPDDETTRGTAEPASRSEAAGDVDRVAQAAQQALKRAQQGWSDPEPSLGRRLGQIGILGWSVIVPTLLGLVLGRWLDHYFGTRVFFSAPLLMLGAAFGLWSAWKWMHRQGGSS
jgi:ATP synthase protein I